jgi:hypothetical protein
MNAVFPTSKYKIVLILSIFVFIVTFFVYSSIDINENKNENYSKIIINQLNSSLLEAILSLNYSIFQTVKQPRIFCMILTTPKNFNEKVKRKKNGKKYLFIFFISDCCNKPYMGKRL